MRLFPRLSSRGRLFLAAAMVLALSGPCLSGCSSMMSSAAGDMAVNLRLAVADSPDPETVRQAAPAYLILVDAMLKKNPKNEALLETGAGLYAAYSLLFVKDGDRARRLSDRALALGSAALCVREKKACGLAEMDADKARAVLAGLDAADVPALYSLGTAWAAWLSAHKEDLGVACRIPGVSGIMERVVELDEGYQKGSAHVALGTLDCLVSPALGGKPEVGRAHFERAIELSRGENLMAKVALANHYARVTLNRELHDRLLNEVLAAKTDAEGFALTNAIARDEARKLLESADEWF